MKGTDFRAIRKFNRISQKDIAMEMGFRDPHTISKVENKERVPPIFIKQLSNLVGYDLSNDNTVKKFVSEIPEEYFQENRGRKKIRYVSIFDMM